MVNLRLEAIIESDFRSEGFAIQKESIGQNSTIFIFIETTVVASESETESSGELIGSSPSNARTEAHSPTHGVFSGVDHVTKIEVTGQIQEQRELVADGATHITDVRLKGQVVDLHFVLFAQKFKLGLSETVASTQSNGPMVVDVVTNFRSDAEMGVVLVEGSVDTTANPPILSVS